MRLQERLRALWIERSAKIRKLVELHYALTDVRSHNEARQSIPKTAFVQDVEKQFLLRCATQQLALLFLSSQASRIGDAVILCRRTPWLERRCCSAF